MTTSQRFSRNHLFAYIALTILAAGAAHAQVAPPPASPATIPTAPDISTVAIPPVRREFRGVWVATVDNDDWPSRQDLTADQQKAEFIALLDRAKALNLNAILLQVRPACDALYPSAIEPWSPYLTGQMGVGPTPAYDPLAFAVAEAHKRGMELHAWFNPFRARQAGAAAHWSPSANHVSVTHPDWVRAYGKMLWLDPGLKAVRDYSLSVVADVVQRYDVDGVHIDDYFYPYKIMDAAKKTVDFPDDATFAAYQSGGGTLSRSDWRRSNIDDFVQRMYAGVKAIKPWVKVGISPFGIWRPGNPAQIKGLDSYEELYGDSRRWLNEGWVDYWTPQLYWRIEQTPQSFPVLLNWWKGENTKSRHLWPGLYTSQATVGPHAKWPADEIEYQVETTRGIEGSDAGAVHFSAKFLRADSTVTGTLPGLLRTTVYAEPALVPASPWLAAPLSNVAPATPAPPQLIVIPPKPAAFGNGMPSWSLVWSVQKPAIVPTFWLLQWRIGGVWSQATLAGSATTYEIAPATAASGQTAVAGQQNLVALTPIDHNGVAGATARAAL